MNYNISCVNLDEVRDIAHVKYMTQQSRRLYLYNAGSQQFARRIADELHPTRRIYLSKLVCDTYKIRNFLKSYILDSVVYRLSISVDIDKGLEFKLWNIDRMIDRDKLGLYLKIKPSIYFTGFWDRNTRLYNKKNWDDANIGLMVEELNKVLSPITITNISNRKLSTQLVLLCTVPASSNFQTEYENTSNILELQRNPVFNSGEENPPDNAAAGQATNASLPPENLSQQSINDEEHRIRKVCSIS